jgi:hypothetical protein
MNHLSWGLEVVLVLEVVLEVPPEQEESGLLLL